MISKKYLVDIVRRRPVLSFYVLAFVISWSGGLALVAASHQYFELSVTSQAILLVLFGIGPAVSGIVVKSSCSDDPNEPRLLTSLLPVRHRWWLYFFALLFPLALIVPMFLIEQVFGARGHAVPRVMGVQALFTNLLFSILANPWEEVGWRGFALPRIQDRIGRTSAAFVVGVITGIWHLPLFWWKGGSMSSFPFFEWLVGSVAISFALAWIYNWSGRRLFYPWLLHIAFNTWFNVMGISSFRYYAIASGIVIVGFVIANQIHPIQGKD